MNLEVKYYKSSNILTLIGKTTSAGSGRPDNVPEMVRYCTQGGDGVVEEEEEGPGGSFGMIDIRCSLLLNCMAFAKERRWWCVLLCIFAVT